MSASTYQAGPPQRAIAVIGAACRLPGGIVDLDGLWDALLHGRDLVTEVGEERFEVARFVDTSMPRPGKSYTGAGGFLTDIGGFDAAYFGISPKEAAQMDPQHRLLLEMAVEACDDAGLAPASLAGSDTAVFVGVSDNSYGALQMLTPEGINAYTMSGAASSIAANRLSHFLDLRGPSLIVDTACSSSLVALVQACQTLLAGTSRSALVGGVNVLLSPYHFVGFSQAAMLSPSGRCRSFSAGADGYVRAEGGGVVLLKRLADALADGDRVHGVIVDGAVNSDGRTPGLALPRADAQEALLSEVYRRAGVAADDVAYLEAHGTGTPVGDPVECRAIGRALGVHRADALPIGSIKSNLGHLEPASGMAGLFKALLVLRHGVIPASLHATPASEHIDFAALRLTVPTRRRPVALNERSVVGVNSFGFGGTNAHAILAPPPPPAPRPWAPPSDLRPFVVSARSRTALDEAVRRAADRLADAAPQEFYDLAYTACRRRGQHGHRAAVLAADPARAAEQLRLLVAGTGAEGAATGEGVENGGVVFAFCGNGAQWAAMGADLLAEDPAFRRAVESADALLAPLMGWSVVSELRCPAERPQLSATDVAQPLLFAVQLGLVAALRQRGVEPAAVVGHSVGEVAAAHTAGILTLEDAVRIVVARGRAQAGTRGDGRMAAVSLPPARAAELLAAHPGLTIACVNTDRDVTIAGPADRLGPLLAELADGGVAFAELELEYAFHSPAMDPVEEPLRAALSGLRPGRARVPLVSTVTGAPVEGTKLDAEYWWRNVREPVLFAPAVDHLLGEGHQVFVDVGPRPALRPYLRRAAAGARQRTVVVPTLDEGVPGRTALRTAVATLLAAGARVDWDRHFPHRGRVADLPGYPWQRERHWNSSPRAWTPSSRDEPREHPLLGGRLRLLEPTWRGPVEPVAVPWLADHRVGGAVIMPATGYLEMALAAGRRALGSAVEVECLEIPRAIVVPWDNPGSVWLEVALSQEDGVLSIASRDGREGGPPRQHARGRVRTLLRRPPPPVDLTAALARCGRRVDAREHYAALADAGLRYGPAFQPLCELHAGGGEVVAAYRYDAPGDEYEAHPALLDGALQAGAPLLLADAQAGGQAYLPAAIGAARVWRRPAPSGLVHVRERGRCQVEVCWDITVCDEDGTVAVELEGCRLRRFRNSRAVPVSRTATVLRAAPRPDVPADRCPLPGPRQILEASRGRIAELQADWRRLRYGRMRRDLNAFFAHGLARAFAALLPDPAAAFTMEDLVAAGMAPRHGRLFELTGPLLCREGLLEHQADGGWRIPAGDSRMDELGRRLVRDFPAFCVEVTLSNHLLRRLPALLRGECDAWELLAPEGRTDTLDQLYDIAPLCRFHNRVLQALLRTMVERWPTDRPLRVLEIGAGTGGTTAAVLPLLPGERTHYVHTDVSAGFATRARKRFEAYDFVEYRTFDLDADPAGQGFADGGFDLVIAANALHTAADPARSLRWVARLLAPGGQLLALETHDAELLAPFFGTLDGFWPSTDRHGTLLPAARWPALLSDCGFSQVVRTGDGHRSRQDMSVLLAAVPDRPVEPAPLPEADGQTVWLVAGEQPGALPEAVAAALSARTTAFSEDPDHWRRLLPESATDVGVVLLLGDGPRQPEAMVECTARRAAVLRALAVGWAGSAQTVRRTVWLVTRPSGALPAPERPLAPLDAAVWGVARTLANEQPELRLRRLSLERSADPGQDARRVVRELLTPCEEDEIALTAGGRFVPRTVELAAAQGTVDGAEVASHALRVRDPGLTYKLAWVQGDAPRPGPGEVVIAVRAAALNYRDVMRAVGLLPFDADEGAGGAPGLGMECAGVVAAVGEKVTSVAVGDRVFGVAPDAFGSHAVTVEHAVAKLPGRMSFAEAATMPVVFLTVHYGLGQLARLAPGETVLVHGGAGGVGLAALQYARRCGARVIATAGTPAKRDLLRMLGVEHVLDSRGLDFAEEVMALTGGAGVDVVVNSLAGEAISRGLELLRPGGRFVELGKRDIYENKPLLLRPFRRNIAFYGVDLTALLHQPELAARQFAQVAGLIRSGRYRPLPHCVYPASRVEEAFRLMQHSRHVGKVVVAFDPLDEPLAVERREAPPKLDPEDTYLVAGGLSGFGAATARWLADRGARHLALVGRRGADSPQAPALLAELAGRGVHGIVHRADVTDAAAMRRVAEAAETAGRPLRGIVHSAMHLDDAALTDLGDERFRAVLAPKLAGGAVLDELADGRALDLFLVHSSAATTIGNLTQSPYVAGNLFLEALVRRRRRGGGAGTAILWGAIGETGYVARSGLTEAMTRMGLAPVLPREAFRAADDLLCSGADVAGVARCDWLSLLRLLPAVDVPRLAALLPAEVARRGQSREDVLRALAGMSAEQARQFIADSFAASLAEVLQLPVEQLDHHRRLDEYGVDSLMATEVLVTLRQQYDVDIPPMELLRSSGTIADLSRIVHVRLGLAAGEDTATPIPQQRRAEAADEVRPTHQPAEQVTDTLPPATDYPGG